MSGSCGTKDSNIEFFEHNGNRVPEVMNADGSAKIPPGVEVGYRDRNPHKSYVQNDSLFDIDQTDKKGRTNLDRMKSGIAPEDKNGNSINLHHERQKNDGRRIEISETEHSGKHGLLHPNSESEIDRSEFSNETSRYWRDRAKQIENNVNIPSRIGGKL